ncbi:MAG: molybdopterin-binding protein [Promethearchaeati archaeon SRVP18_Atabeyarchaeia-1]
MNNTKLKTAELIFAGNEILNGSILNTNSQWIAQVLTSIGIQIKRMDVIEDNADVIARSVNESIGRKPDYIVMSGGLGPTYDDVTLEGVAKALGRHLEVNPTALKMVRDRYILAEKAGLVKVAESERLIMKMASLPSDALPLPNPVGTAPGVMAELGMTTIFALPGVPVEMKAILNYSMVPWLKEHLGSVFHAEKRILVTGVGESRLGPIIEEAMNRIGDIWIKSCVKGAGRSEVCIATTAAEEEVAKRKVREASKMIIEGAKVLGGDISE